MIEVELPNGQILEIETDDPEKAAEAARQYMSRLEGGAAAVGSGARGVFDAAQKEYSALTRPRAAPEAPMSDFPERPPLGTPEREAWEQDQQRQRDEAKEARSVIQQPSASLLGQLGFGGVMGYAGAQIGAAAAAPIAPVPGYGPIAQLVFPMIGGTIGYGTGLYTSEIAPRVAAWATESGDRFLDPSSLRDYILEEMKVDLATSAGASAAFRGASLAGRAAFDFLTGVTGDAKKTVMEIAREFGVKLPQVSASSNIASGYNKIIGRFPFIGSPAMKQGSERLEEVADSAQRLFKRHAPIASIPEVSEYLSTAARGKYEAFHKEAGRLYDNYRDFARQEGDIIPVGPIDQSVENALAKMDRLLSSQSGEPRRAVRDEYAKVIDAFTDVLDETAGKDMISVDTMDALVEMLEGSLRQMKVEGKGSGTLFSAITDVVSGLEQAERSIRAGSPAAQALKDADTFYAKFMSTFETPVGRQFTREDPGAFRSRSRMTREQARPKFNQDELYNLVFSSKSADAQRTLRDIVGQDAYREAVASHVEQAVQSAIKDGRVDTRSLKEALGFTSDQRKANALGAALQASGVDKQRLDLYINMLDRLDPVALQDVSTFVARRAALGGLNSAVRSLGIGSAILGGGAATGGLPVLGITVGLRWLTGSLNNPLIEKELRRLSKLSPNSQAARNTATRVIRIMTEDALDETEGPRRDVMNTVGQMGRAAQRVGEAAYQGYEDLPPGIKYGVPGAVFGGSGE